jgi:hypothetical protein
MSATGEAPNVPPAAPTRVLLEAVEELGLRIVVRISSGCRGQE